MKSRFSLFIMVIIISTLACGSPATGPDPSIPEVTSEEESSQSESHVFPTLLPTKANVPAPTEIAKSTKIPTKLPLTTLTKIPTNTPLPPLPDFDAVITFGGGGAEIGCEEYPPNGNQIWVEGAGYGSLAVLCVFLQNVDSSVPIRLQLSQVEGGIDLWSRDLIFDMNKQLVLWDGYTFRLYDQIIEMGGLIDSWEDGNVKFALAIQLPLGLPAGDWQITIDRPGGVPVSGVFQTSKEAGVSYINALDTRSRRELKPGWCCGQNPQLLQFPDHESLLIMGTDYPPNTPVHILVYKELDIGGYGLFFNNVMVTDDRGVIWEEIYQTFEVGSYILYGITNPDTLLGGENYTSCQSALGNAAGASCDYFIVMDIVTP